MDVAYRLNINAKKARKEPAVSIDDTGGDDDCPEATWADGHKACIKDLTCDQLRKSKEAHKSGSSSDPEMYWQGEAADTHHRISARFRTDRNDLISIYEQGRQICQVRADYFGKYDTQEEKKATQKVAADFMVELAKQYAKGGMDDKQLKALKDSKLKGSGLSKGTKRASAETANLDVAEGAIKEESRKAPRN